MKTRILIGLAAVAVLATSARAQNPLAEAKKKAQGAKAASDAHTEAMQRPEAPAPKAAPAQKSAAPAEKPGASGKPATPSAPVPDTGGPPPSIYREVFEYERDGRRDPFVSLLTTNELRPTLGDLKLTGILFDHSGRHSIATLHDQTNNAQYRVTVGSVLGRMRVTAIQPLTVVFTIDEFGTTRKDSLVLRDSTNKSRGK